MKQTFQGHEWFPTFTRCVSSGRLTSVWEAPWGACSSTALQAKRAVHKPSLFTVSSLGARETKCNVQSEHQLPVGLQTQSSFPVCTRHAAPETQLAQKGWGHSCVQPSSPLWEMYSPTQAAIYSRAFTELLWLERYHRSQHITKISGRRGLAPGPKICFYILFTRLSPV